MCEPVPNEPADCRCGLCEACVETSRNAMRQGTTQPSSFNEEPVRVFVDPALLSRPKQLDPGLQTDLWELNKPAQAAKRLSKARFGFVLDPKDVVIEVKHTGHLVKVKLSHKPTGFSCEEGGVGDQKEAIHSRLWWKLKGMVEANYKGAAAAIDKAVQDSMRTVRISSRLAPATRELIVGFAEAMADKLLAAQEKYGYWDGWSDPDFIHECRTHLRQHLDKGDPRDVANYCAFLWWHNASTVPTELLAAGDIPFEVWQERVACAQIADTFAHEEGEGERRYSGNVISARILARTNKRVAPAPVAEARTVPEPQLAYKDATLYGTGVLRQNQDGSSEHIPVGQLSLRKQLDNTPLSHSGDRFDLAMRIDKLTQEDKEQQ